MTDNPLVLLAGIVIIGYAFHLWRSDLRDECAGKPNPKAFPGATPASLTAVVIAVVGAILILAAETAGEYAFDFDQSDITLLFGIFTLTAAFLEELIFRGFLVVERKGKALLIGSIIFFSVVFALIHPFLWEWDSEEGLILQMNGSAWFSTIIVFINSLWFYAVRFLPFNPRHSLIPCIAAHLSSNLGVLIVKGAQGHVVGIY